MGFDLLRGGLAPDGGLAEGALDFVGVHGARFELEGGGELGLRGFWGDAEEGVEGYVGAFGGGDFGVEAEDLLVWEVVLVGCIDGVVWERARFEVRSGYGSGNIPSLLQAATKVTASPKKSRNEVNNLIVAMGSYQYSC